MSVVSVTPVMPVEPVATGVSVVSAQCESVSGRSRRETAALLACGAKAVGCRCRCRQDRADSFPRSIPTILTLPPWLIVVVDGSVEEPRDAGPSTDEDGSKHISLSRLVGVEINMRRWMVTEPPPVNPSTRPVIRPTPPWGGEGPPEAWGTSRGTLTTLRTSMFPTTDR
jgi:hypothetical protein